jgi:hypothetical protein
MENDPAFHPNPGLFSPTNDPYHAYPYNASPGEVTLGDKSRPLDLASRLEVDGEEAMCLCIFLLVNAWLAEAEVVIF